MSTLCNYPIFKGIPRPVSNVSIPVMSIIPTPIRSAALARFTHGSHLRNFSKATKIKVLTSKNILELNKTGFNSFHIDNLPTGVYILDVIVVKGKTQAAYEGILVIGRKSYEVLNKEITTRNTA